MKRKPPKPAKLTSPMDRRLSAWPLSGGIGIALGSHDELGGVSVCLHASIEQARRFHSTLGAAIEKVEVRS